MPSITERFQGLMSTMWSSRSTTTDASPTPSPSLGVGANQASIIVSMSPTDSQKALPSTSSSSTESAANSGSTTFTARLRNIFNGIREKCSSAFATIRTNVASAFTRVVTWFSNLRGGNRDETEVREFSSDRPSSNPPTDPNAGQVEEPTAEEGQGTPSPILLAAKGAEVAQMGLEIGTGDFSDSELHSDGNESRDASSDPSLGGEEGENQLLHRCMSPPSEQAQVLEEEAHVSEKAPLPAAPQGRADADADASLDAIAERARGIITFPALEPSFVSLIHADQASQLLQTVAGHFGHRDASSPRPPLFSNDEEKSGSRDSSRRRGSSSHLDDLLAAPQSQQAGAGRRGSGSVEVELTGPEAPSESKMEKAAAISPSRKRGGAKGGANGGANGGAKGGAKSGSRH